MIYLLTLRVPASSVYNILQNRLDPNQAQQNVEYDLNPNCFTLIVFLYKVL